MKALAATSVRQYEKAAESLDEYFRTVELGLSVVLDGKAEQKNSPKKELEGSLLLLIFGSDHGLAGRFNEQIVSYALDEYWKEEKGLEGLPQDNCIFAIGEQVVSRTEASRISLEKSFNVPSSINAITPFIQLLLEDIEKWQESRSVKKVILFYNRPHTGGFSPQAETIIPVDISKLRDKRYKWQSRSLPTYTMESGKLLSALLRQYFFVSLYRATALSLAAENTSRLAAMQAAEKNIDERLTELKTAYQQERQTAITEELLDIISGFRAVQGSKTNT